MRARQPAHGETWEDDHFANWTHSSPENVRLLYGESGLFSGLRKKKNSTATEPVPPFPLPPPPAGARLRALRCFFASLRCAARGGAVARGGRARGAAE